MKCLLCEGWGLSPICPKCERDLPLTPRKRDNYGLSVYSFYRYGDIELLLKTKYSLIGSRIYKILAKRAHDYFKSTINADFEGVRGIGIDDKPTRFYSHSGVIAKGFGGSFAPYFGVLHAMSGVSYAGQSLEYRKNHSRDFAYRGKSGIAAVLLDDIITTGLTIKQAHECLESCGVEVLFALTLSDARD